MSLTVESPLGSSPLCEAVIKVLEQIDGLDNVRVGPPVYDLGKVALACAQHHDDLKLTVPLKKGFRTFLISHFHGSAATPALCGQIIRALRHTALPAEVAENDRGEPRSRRQLKAREASPPIERKRPRQLFQPPPVPLVPDARLSPKVIVPPAPALTIELTTPRSSPSVAPTNSAVLTEAKKLADENSVVEGLALKLANVFGAELSDALQTTINTLVSRGLLECIADTHHGVYPQHTLHRIPPDK